MAFFIPRTLARSVRDYVDSVTDVKPWALTLAERCYDMPAGTLVHLPFAGGVYDQPELLLTSIEHARYAWYVFRYMPANKMAWGPAEAEYIRRVAEEEENLNT